MTCTLTGATFEEPPTVWMTHLAGDVPDVLCASLSSVCRRGDVNTDGYVDADDIQPFVDALITGELPGTGEPFEFQDPCPYDLDGNCRIDLDDLPPFVCLLIRPSQGFECGIVPSPPAPPPGGEGGGGCGESAQSSSAESSSMEGQSGPSSDGTDAAAQRAFAQWLKKNTRSDHPELSDEQYFRLFKSTMIELGLWQ